MDTGSKNTANPPTLQTSNDSSWPNRMVLLHLLHVFHFVGPTGLAVRQSAGLEVAPISREAYSPITSNPRPNLKIQ